MLCWLDAEVCIGTSEELWKLRHQEWTPGMGVSGSRVIRKRGSEISVGTESPGGLQYLRNQSRDIQL